jgi:hypothetical protein
LVDLPIQIAHEGGVGGGIVHGSTDLRELAPLATLPALAASMKTLVHGRPSAVKHIAIFEYIDVPYNRQRR